MDFEIFPLQVRRFRSFAGSLYIQANNALVFRAAEAAALFARVFDIAFEHSRSMSADPIFKQWHLVQLNDKPPIHFCFSPHQDSDLSLSALGAAIDQATSSVFFCVAFLNQAKSGAVREAIDRLRGRTCLATGFRIGQVASK
jgi:hypothetical protein